MNYNQKNMEVYEMYLDSNKARNYETIVPHIKCTRVE